MLASMEFLLLLLAFISVFLFYFLLLLLQEHRKTKERRQLLPPGPPGLPFFGNLHQLIKYNATPHLYLCQLSKKYGPLMSLRLGVVPVIVISSAKMAKEALKIHDLAFSGRPCMLGQQKLSYNGSDLIFAQYGGYWREIRKFCVLHLFSTKRVQSFRPVHEEEVRAIINKISTFSSPKQEVNMSEMLMSLSNDIICRIAFGKRYEGKGVDGCGRNSFHKLLNEAEALASSIFVSDYFSFMGWVDKLTGLCGRVDKNFRELDLIFQEIIDEHLDPKRLRFEQEDIVDILLQLRSDQLFTSDLTFDQIKALITDVFIAGTDTSAGTIIWAMTELMKNPRVMKTAQEELRSLIKEDFIDEDDLPRLTYLKAVVKETMRVHPIAPLLVPRETIEKCTIDGYEIQPKTIVYVNAWAIVRDLESWEKPEEFLPERFLGNPIDFKGQDFELIPFGAGRRRCPGMLLGLMTVELTLANLLYSFDWDLPNGMKEVDVDTEAAPGIVMHKKVPLCLLAKKYLARKSR
ncbi:6,7,8-trihydroxycoumarin synthase-like [Malania oleifera]|uniref:6,7,8-trihydroxycoumarin synthase-like n=1 Tax=Malania oleifera TaxID=397392 RepID=UPI0025AD9FE6|nr:6,7,8-trihydroxycoumarin synthase-like [Malania oleifera]